MRDIVTVSISTPYPSLGHIADIDINPRVTAVSYSTQPGGWGRGSVGLVPPDYGYRGGYPALPEPIEAPENAHVEFRLGGSVVYEGVITRVAPNRTGFECMGYGVWAPRWSTVDLGGDSDDDRVTSGAFVREAIRVCPWLVVGEVWDAGIYHTWSETQYQKSASIIERFASEGDGTTPGMFRVYEGRLASFTRYQPADVPDLVLSYDPEMMDVGWEYERVDGVRIVYRDRDGLQRIWPEDGLPFTRPGVDRNDELLLVETLTGSASPDGAIATAMTYLAQHSAIGLTGRVRFTDWQELNQRYGNTAQMLGYGETIITGTTVDLFAGTTDLTLGQPIVGSGAWLMGTLARTQAALAAKTDLITGARTL